MQTEGARQTTCTRPSPTAGHFTCSSWQVQLCGPGKRPGKRQRRLRSPTFPAPAPDRAGPPAKPDSSSIGFGRLDSRPETPLQVPASVLCGFIPLAGSGFPLGFSRAGPPCWINSPSPSRFLAVSTPGHSVVCSAPTSRLFKHYGSPSPLDKRAVLTATLPTHLAAPSPGLPFFQPLRWPLLRSVQHRVLHTSSSSPVARSITGRFEYWYYDGVHSLRTPVPTRPNSSPRAAGSGSDSDSGSTHHSPRTLYGVRVPTCTAR